MNQTSIRLQGIYSTMDNQGYEVMHPPRITAAPSSRRGLRVPDDGLDPGNFCLWGTTDVARSVQRPLAGLVTA